MTQKPSKPLNRLEVRGGKPFYCRQHPDFEGLDMGKLHDHLEKNHKELTPEQTKEIIFTEDYRLTDANWISRTWGRPPKFSTMVSDSEIEKK